MAATEVKDRASMTTLMISSAVKLPVASYRGPTRKEQAVPIIIFSVWSLSEAITMP